MEVIDHQPHAWFLLADGEQLFLDANCSASFFDYTVLIELNAAEKAAFGRRGRAYLDWLAHDIHYTAPAVRGSKSAYKTRNLTVQQHPLNDLAQKAIEAWLQQNPPG